MALLLLNGSQISELFNHCDRLGQVGLGRVLLQEQTSQHLLNLVALGIGEYQSKQERRLADDSSFPVAEGSSIGVDHFGEFFEAGRTGPLVNAALLHHLADRLLVLFLSRFAGCALLDLPLPVLSVAFLGVGVGLGESLQLVKAQFDQVVDLPAQDLKIIPSGTLPELCPQVLDHVLEVGHVIQVELTQLPLLLLPPRQHQTLGIQLPTNFLEVPLHSAVHYVAPLAQGLPGPLHQRRHRLLLIGHVLLTEQTEMVIPPHEGLDPPVEEIYLAASHLDLGVVVAAHQFVEGLSQLDVLLTEQTVRRPDPVQLSQNLPFLLRLPILYFSATPQGLGGDGL